MIKVLKTKINKSEEKELTFKAKIEEMDSSKKYLVFNKKNCEFQFESFFNNEIQIMVVEFKKDK